MTIDQILEAADKATCGPWESSLNEQAGGYSGIFHREPYIHVATVDVLNAVAPISTIALIAGAPQLAAEVRELRAMLYHAALDKTADDAEISRLRKQLKERA